MGVVLIYRKAPPKEGFGGRLRRRQYCRLTSFYSYFALLKRRARRPSPPNDRNGRDAWARTLKRSLSTPHTAREKGGASGERLPWRREHAAAYHTVTSESESSSKIPSSGGGGSHTPCRRTIWRAGVGVPPRPVCLVPPEVNQTWRSKPQNCDVGVWHLHSISESLICQLHFGIDHRSRHPHCTRHSQ